MEINNDIIILPELLIKACSSKIYYRSNGIDLLSVEIGNDHFYQFYISNINHEKTTDSKVLKDKILGLGLFGVIECVSELDLFHSKYKCYPNEYKAQEVLDILKFEERFRYLKSRTNRRVFLLGHFLKKIGINLNQFSRVIDSIVDDAKGSSQFPDWYLYTLFLLSEILTENELRNIVDKKNQVGDSIFNVLNEEQLIFFSENMLKYGFAIGETDFLTFNKAFV